MLVIDNDIGANLETLEVESLEFCYHQSLIQTILPMFLY
jgi:hypothetical protein